MVRRKHLIVGALIVIVGILAIRSLFPSEEKKVKRQFLLLSESVSKSLDEMPLTMASKIQTLGKLFSERCEVEIPVESFSGSYTSEEVVSFAARARALFSELKLKFFDLEIHFPDRDEARATLTAKLRGKLVQGEDVDETREVQCTLRKTENRWLFQALRVVEVLKK